MHLEQDVRETAFSKDFDEIVELLKHEKDNGKMVMGPAFSFADIKARRALSAIHRKRICSCSS